MPAILQPRLSAQAELPLDNEPSSRRPLVSLDVAMDRLDLASHDAVLARIEAGEIEWAWDIAMPGSDRREVRIFWRCVRGRMFELRVEDSVYNEIFPTHWARVRATSIYRRWTCSEQLVSGLIAAGQLQAITGAARGADGSPEVTRESVIDFLRGRKL